MIGVNNRKIVIVIFLSIGLAVYDSCATPCILGQLHFSVLLHVTFIFCFYLENVITAWLLYILNYSYLNNF